MEYLPSKKVLVVVITAGVLVWAVAYKSDSQNPVAKVQPGVFVAHAEPIHPDTDNDGLPDWEEILFDTKINNPDSNNNGVLDGEELVSQKVYEKLTEAEINILSELQNSFKSLGPIEGNISETLLNEVVARQNNLSATGRLNENTKNQLVNALSSFSYSNQDSGGYINSDIKTTDDSSVEAVNTYAKAVLGFIGINLDIYRKDTLQLINAWFDTRNKEYLDSLVELQGTYENLSRGLASLEVPTDFLDIHLALVNNFHNSSKAIKEILRTPNDPIAGMLGAANFVNYRSKRTNIIAELSTTFNLHTNKILNKK